MFLRQKHVVNSLMKLAPDMIRCAWERYGHDWPISGDTVCHDLFSRLIENKLEYADIIRDNCSQQECNEIEKIQLCKVKGHLSANFINKSMLC